MSESSKASITSRLSGSQISFVWGLAAGVLIWLLSPILGGESEPFDNWGYYIPALCLSGFVVAVIRGRGWLAIAAGIISGQIVCVILSPSSWQAGSMMPVGIMFMIVYGVLPLVFAAIGVIVSRLLRRPR